ncbi:MAG TPA: DUF91 domain-containing protein [Terriglobia bacterium]|nr:DUF91 domain-containing protein [Terriglobia bacterium]
MAKEVRLWQVNDDSLIEISPAKLDKEDRIEKWVLRDISVLASDLLVIGEQVETAYGKFIDLLCMDSSGGLAIVELKRDKTPREVTAQALDYASWVKMLSADEIEAIASAYLKGETLDTAFQKKFNAELPDVLNEHHSMLVVSSEINDSTERIIRYLSEAGISINAVSFGFFQSKDGREFLSRTFTVAPEEAEKTSAKGKRIVPSPAEMERRAEDAGVGEIYRQCVGTLAPCFENHGTNKTALWFSGATEDGSSRKIILSLIPGKSSSQKGLRYQVYGKRLAEYADTTTDVILKHLPSNPEDYAYYPTAPDDLRGWAGYVRSHEEIQRIADLFVTKEGAAAPH